MFVKHIIKTLHVSVTIVLLSSGGCLSCLVLLLPSLLACVVYLVCGCNVCNIIFALEWFHDFIYQEMKHLTEMVWTYLCVCVRAWCTCLWDVWSWTHNQTSHSTSSTSGTHTHRQHYSHIPNERRKQAEKVVTALSTKDYPLKMVKQLWSKHVGF